MNNVHVTVFLVSLKAGGVALNLTEASRVYLMDSWWNPAVEYRMDTYSHTRQLYDVLIDPQKPWTAFIDLANTDLSKPLNSL